MEVWPQVQEQLLYIALTPMLWAACLGGVTLGILEHIERRDGYVLSERAWPVYTDTCRVNAKVTTSGATVSTDTAGYVAFR